MEKFCSSVVSILLRDAVITLLKFYCRQRFIDICDGKVQVGFMTLMKDISLAKTSARGEYLYNKVQHIAYDDVLSQYMFYPQVITY